MGHVFRHEEYQVHAKSDGEPLCDDCLQRKDHAVHSESSLPACPRCLEQHKAQTGGVKVWLAEPMVRP